VEVLNTIRELRQKGMTILAATHNMAEAAQAQRVIVLSEGRIALQGHPHFVFAQEEPLQALQLEAPHPTGLARTIAEHVESFPTDVLTVSELVDAVAMRVESAPSERGGAVPSERDGTVTGVHT
jgi:energy-coupling factor transporter ATP-binding protein EcfA2